MSNKEEEKFDGTGLTTKEKYWGTKQFKNYKEKYHIENMSDLQLLTELVFREALQIRYKKSAEKTAKSETTSDDGGKIPTYIIKTLDENLDKIIQLKKEIGLIQDNKVQDDYDYLDQLKKKFEIWRNENQACRQVTCPFCTKLFYLMIRTDKYDAVKSPFFKDKILYNEHLIKLYKEEKITKSDCAKILGTSEDYISWLIEKWFRKET